MRLRSTMETGSHLNPMHGIEQRGDFLRIVTIYLQADHAHLPLGIGGADDANSRVVTQSGQQLLGEL